MVPSTLPSVEEDDSSNAAEFEAMGSPPSESTLTRMIARRFFIRGDVQGVGYRFFAQRVSARHQIVGYVKNLADGRVEVLAEGPAPEVEAFKHELLTGPRFSTVDQIEEISLDVSGSYSSFRIEH